jgi:MoxR-vWA-beta-propeller ternary system domain bpX4
MELSNFIQQLVTTGTVSVQPGIISFAVADEQQAILLLQQYYNEDIQEMPATAPPFNEQAALWAAKYFYTAVQLTVLRDESEAVINEKLVAFAETVDASAMYSADLILRYLPALLHLAKGLSPADVLVKVLEQTATAWPFSSAGIETVPIKNEAVIFLDASLSIAYTDRLITAKHIKKITGDNIKQRILSAAGMHLEIFWPQAATILKNETNG